MNTDPRIEAAARQVAVEHGYPDFLYPDGMAEVTAKAYRDQGARIIAAADKAAPEPAGFVVVDIKSRKLDWDGELHPTTEAAIKSLTGPYQMWCRTPEEATDERTYYGEFYEILPVMPV